MAEEEKEILPAQVVHPRLGALKDPEDPRDIPMRAILAPVAVPDVIDYEPYMPPVRDQGLRGACVSFGTLAVKEFQEARQRQFREAYDFSEEFVYRQIRLPGGGAYVRDGFKVLANMGVPREKYMPYDTSITDDAEEKPFSATNTAIANAKHYKASKYARLINANDIIQSLWVNGPCIVGIDWQEPWFNTGNVEKIGEYPILPEVTDRSAGGHCVAIVGYLKDRNLLKIRNSWGEGWGKGGYAYIPATALQKVLMDAWTTFDVENPRIDEKKVKEYTDNIAKLTKVFRGSPNFWANRVYEGKQYKIDKIVIHWFGTGTLESADTRFMNAANQSSSTYGVSKGRIWQWVQEKDAPWANGDRIANLTSVTIECDAIVAGQPNAHDLSESDYQLVGQLVRDIADRNGIPLDRAHIYRHSQFKATQCCGTVDVDKIIAIAKGGAPVSNGYPKDVKITIDGLKVRDAANTGGNLAGSQSLSVGDTVKVQNVVKGQYVEYPGIKGTDMWYVSMYGNFFWSGGTDQPVYSAPTPPAPTPPAPTPPAPTPTPPATDDLYRVTFHGQQIGAYQANPIDKIAKLEQSVIDKDARIKELESQPVAPALSEGEKSTLDGLKKLISER